MHTQTQLSVTRLKRAKQTRYNPISSITDPVQIARKLDSFEIGYLKDAVSVWEVLEQRDDLIHAVVSKRKKAAGRQGWTVLIRDSVHPEQRAEAEEHAVALEYFYENLRCENALDRAERGGFKLLARQMMDAVGKRFAVHEIVWDLAGQATSDEGSNNTEAAECPSGSAGSAGASPHRSGTCLLTARFRFVPLSFFENTTGQLRYLESDSAVEGTPLNPGAWMVTVGEGLMMATASAWILKNMTLNDWLLYSERNGRPGLRGITSAAPDSEEWNALETVLTDILSGSAVVHSSTDDIKVIDLAAGGNIPFPDLVDRIDRMIAALWRGADLSTLSRDRGYGASLQEKESATLEQDDAEMLTETLNEYVDAWVIRYLFGDGVKPLANVKVLVTPRESTPADIQIDEFLIRNGALLSIQETMSRYGRAAAKPGERALGPVGLKINTESTEHTENASRPEKQSRDALASDPLSNPTRMAGSMSHRSLTVAALFKGTEDIENASRSRSSAPSAPSAVNKIPSPGLDPSSAPFVMNNTEITENAESASRPEKQSRDALASDSLSIPFVPSVNSVSSAPFVINNTEITEGTENAERIEEVERAANEKPKEDTCFSSVNSVPSVLSTSFANDFTVIQRDWVQLSPYGDFPHSRGLQRVNRAAAEIMVAQFNSFRGRLGRLFGGAPFYVGHPDMPSSSDLADRKAYGWVMQLEAREHGLYGLVKWSDAGLDLLKNAHFKYLSPFWEAKELGSENGRRIFQPVALISVGLTNQPNIPVHPLANEQGENYTESTEDTEITEIINNKNALQAPVGPAPSPRAEPATIHAENAGNTENTERMNSIALAENSAQKISVPSVPSAISAISAISVSNPPRPRRVTLANLHTHSLTENIGRRRGERVRFENAERRRDRIQEAVHAKMRDGLTYHEAWTAVKRERRDWFQLDN